MPLEALPELAAYRDLVLAVAKALWQQRHPARARLPKGFEASFRLVMSQVDEGSAVPLIEREVPAHLPLVDAEQTFFDEAREQVEEVVRSMSEAHTFPQSFPAQAVGRFNAFGRSLMPGEYVLLARPGTRVGPRYDKDVRKRILLRAQSSYEDAVDLTGEVRSADKDLGSFTIRDTEGKKTKVRCSPTFFRVALEGIRREMDEVRVRGIGIFDAQDKLLEVSDVEDVSLIEEGAPSTHTRRSAMTPLAEQLSGLALLPDGWFDGEGRSLDKAGLEWLGPLLASVVDSFRLPRPYLYPTPEGRARVEWPGGAHEVIADFDLTRKEVDLFAIPEVDEEVHELTVRFASAGSETQMVAFLTRHLGVTAGDE